MEDFSRQFLSETVAALEILKQDLRRSDDFAEPLKRETLRRLHTVKGTAQTFGADAAGRLAHELETLTAAIAADSADFADARNVLSEGIALLQESLTEEDFTVPQTFAAKLRVYAPTVPLFAVSSAASVLPREIAAQLSPQETKQIGAARHAGKHLTVLEIGFDRRNFAAELINFREKLYVSSEVIATFPSASFDGGEQIGFRFLTASREKIEPAKATVVWSLAAIAAADSIEKILRQITRHGEEIAAKLGKKVRFAARADENDFSPRELRLIFEILLHLVRNAVDHAFADNESGTIEISVDKTANGARLLIADDGRGIDSLKVRARAIEKNLLGADADLNAEDALNLIFQPEFSTKTNADEISGRGIGLDAVKNAVEKNGGAISVTHEPEKGTKFEVFLPRTVENPTE